MHPIADSGRRSTQTSEGMNMADGKPKSTTPEQDAELDAAFEKARAAMAQIEDYTQEQLDRLCQAIAWSVANKVTFTRLVKEGIEASGLGDPVSRMGKPGEDDAHRRTARSSSSSAA